MGSVAITAVVNGPNGRRFSAGPVQFGGVQFTDIKNLAIGEYLLSFDDSVQPGFEIILSCGARGFKAATAYWAEGQALVVFNLQQGSANGGISEYNPGVEVDTNVSDMALTTVVNVYMSSSDSITSLTLNVSDGPILYVRNGEPIVYVYGSVGRKSIVANLLTKNGFTGSSSTYININAPQPNTGPAIPLDNPGNIKFFFGSRAGHLIENHWNGTAWAWTDHGLPPGTRAATAPGALITDPLKFFMGTADGRLFERYWNGAQWSWTDHGAPPGTRVATAPGALITDPQKFFVGTADGRLFERYWNGGQWVWVDHGMPPGTKVATTPGTLITDPLKFFMGTADGKLFERYWDGEHWNWVDHHWPPTKDEIITGPGALFNSVDAGLKLFVGCKWGQLYEHYWDAESNSWQWTNHSP